MPSAFERNLSLCFNKIKRLQSPPPPPSSQQQPPPPHRHPNGHRRHHSNPNLIKNFNTLYDIDNEEASTTGVGFTFTNTDTDTFVTSTSDAAADFSSAVASNRFFFSSPGESNSIIESNSMSSSMTSTSSSSVGSATSSLINGGVAVPTISPDPYCDFRKSMQEMVEARDDVNDARDNWEYLHELLTCYLDLNPKSAHKFIVGAFADLLVTLMAAENGGGCRNK